MIFPIDTIIADVERYMLLDEGDLIFTGTPAGVGPIEAGDRLEGYLLGELLFDLTVEQPKGPHPIGRIPLRLIPLNAHDQDRQRRQHQVR
jgi:hypothetical protein